MSVILSEAETIKHALGLSESARAKLAGALLSSLPSPFADDDDDGYEEALRRDRLMDEDPDRGISFEQLKEMLAKRPRR